jgi:hypothetical protein
MLRRSYLLLALSGCVAAIGLIRITTAADQPNKHPELKVAAFRNGVDGYAGTVDSEIWALAPTTILDGNPNASSDADNDGGESQVVLRFDSAIGRKPHQVPEGAVVHSARLLVSAFDQGSTVNLHRMLVPFGDAVTWRSMISGVSADGLEASRHKDAFTFGKIAANSSEIVFDVTDTVQSWVNGEDNHGWVFLNTGGNGWDFYVSEFENVLQRPKLVIEYSVVNATSAGSDASLSVASK